MKRRKALKDYSERRPSTLEEFITIDAGSDSDDLIIKGRTYAKQMTVILEEVDDMNQTFKGNNFKSTMPINGSMVSIESAENEIDFEVEDDEDH
jgi:hypothetical protein